MEFADKLQTSGIHELNNGILLFDVLGFGLAIRKLVELSGINQRKKQFEEIISSYGLKVLYIDKKAAVYGETDFGDSHEIITAKKLITAGISVIKAPDGLFKKGERKFDAWLVNNVYRLIPVDFKAIMTPTSNAVEKAIIGAIGQADKLVIDIQTGINKKGLSYGLRRGMIMHTTLVSIFLIYKGKGTLYLRNALLSKNFSVG